MQSSYSPDFPLGLNVSRYNPRIDFYLSWQELADSVRTGTISDSTGKSYLIPTNKEDQPLFTFKGNYGNHRSNANFSGERSPYVGIDIDLDEKASGISKKAVTAEQLAKIVMDLDTLKSMLSQGERNFFFCKQTSSGCGLHIIVALKDVPEGAMDDYEKEIFWKFQEALGTCQQSLHFHYKVDNALLGVSQGLHINHDPGVIFNPEKITSASIYPPRLQHGEAHEKDDNGSYSIREANEADRVCFSRFERFIERKKIRMPYTDIMRLSIIFFQLWPDATADDFYHKCKGFNSERSLTRGNSKNFLSGLYKNVKTNIHKNYKGKKITVNSLYYLMELYAYKYEPDEELCFKGYLSSIEQKLFTAFDIFDNILLESPTGSGKTKLLFNYLKRLAILYPEKQFVVALPYTSLVEQFAQENSDERFTIRTMHGGIKDQFPGFVQIEDCDYSGKKPKAVLPGSIFELNPDDFISPTPAQKGHGFYRMKNNNKKKRTVKKLQPEPILKLTHRQFNIWCSTYDSAHKIKGIHTLVIDEAHDMVKQLSFRCEAMQLLESIRSKKKIYVTATPQVLLPEVEQFYHIRCIKEDNVKPKLFIHKIKGSLIEATKNSIKETSSSLTFINNKQWGEQIKEELKMDGYRLDLYNSDTRNETHQHLLQEHGLIAPHSVATSYLIEGINVLNDSIERINLVAEYDIDAIRQGAARPRRCTPQIHLFLKETNYVPGGQWRFVPYRKYSEKLSEIQACADELNEMSEGIYPYDNDRNKFNVRDPNLLPIFNEEFAQHSFLRRPGFGYTVNRAMVKMSIAEQFKHWLYHKQRDSWQKELEKYFEVVETTVQENEAKDPKRTDPPFEIFKNISESLMLEFHQFNDMKKHFPSAQYSAKMKEWAKTNHNLQFSKKWKQWTERYLKMKEYGAATDYEIIGNGRKFFFWQKKADVSISLKEGAWTAKECRFTKQNFAAINFLLSVDFTKDRKTKTELFIALNEHLKSKNLPIFKNQRIFYSSLANVLKITVKQVKATGIRYVSEIKDVRSECPLMSTEERERIRLEKVDGSWLL